LAGRQRSEKAAAIGPAPAHPLIVGREPGDDRGIAAIDDAESAYAFLTEAERATLPAGHMKLASLQSGTVYLDFWLNNGDALLQRFITFAAQ
jgi:hypothetical protein